MEAITDIFKIALLIGIFFMNIYIIGVINRW